MSNVPRIVSIVEGKGESERHSVPILIQRIAEGVGAYVDCFGTVRTRRDTFPRIAEVRGRAVQAARIKAGDGGAILIVLDSDGEPPCLNRSHRSSPCLLGTELLEDVAPLAAGLPIAVTMAECEFESWFVAAAPSLVGDKGLRDGVVAPESPDTIRNAKGWLTVRMADPNQTYSPTAVQARFTRQFDMQMARERSPSFDFCHREIERLIRAVATG